MTFPDTERVPRMSTFENTMATSYSATMDARARARRDGGPLSTVEYDHKQDGRVTVAEAPYDALALARCLVANGRTNVVYTTPGGIVYRDAEIMAVGY